jgi:dynein heavy chain
LLEGGLDGITVYWKFLQDQLNNSVMLVRKKLSKLARVSVNALIVIDVHAKDVIGTLVE